MDIVKTTLLFNFQKPSDGESAKHYISFMDKLTKGDVYDYSASADKSTVRDTTGQHNHHPHLTCG